MNIIVNLSNEKWQSVKDGTWCGSEEIAKGIPFEPCEDAISRQAVMDCFKKWQPYMATRLWDFEQELSALPPVNQKPKTGHWVHGEYCSECGCDVPAYIIDWKWQKDMDAKYCPNCGCRMVEPQERNDK